MFIGINKKVLRYIREHHQVTIHDGRATILFLNKRPFTAMIVEERCKQGTSQAIVQPHHLYWTLITTIEFAQIVDASRIAEAALLHHTA